MIRKRRTNKEYKLIHIILGLTTGFFIGGILVYYGLNRQNVSLLNLDIVTTLLTKNLEQEYNDSISSQTSNDLADNIYLVNRLIKDSIQKDPVVNQEELVSGVNKKYNSILITSETNFADHITAQKINTQIITNKHDLYFLFDTVDIFKSQPKPAPKDIQVEKGKLIHVKTIQDPKNVNNKDSTRYPELYSLLGKNISPYNKSNILIEFWETPLNTKGYIRGKKKLVLYGISLHDFTSLKYYKETLYLKYLNQYYPLEFTSEFKSLEPVSDLALIEQLQHL